MKLNSSHQPVFGKCAAVAPKGSALISTVAKYYQAANGFIARTDINRLEIRLRYNSRQPSLAYYAKSRERKRCLSSRRIHLDEGMNMTAAGMPETIQNLLKPL